MGNHTLQELIRIRLRLIRELYQRESNSIEAIELRAELDQVEEEIAMTTDSQQLKFSVSTLIGTLFNKNQPK